MADWFTKPLEEFGVPILVFAVVILAVQIYLWWHRD